MYKLNDGEQDFLPIGFYQIANPGVNTLRQLAYSHIPQISNHIIYPFAHENPADAFLNKSI